MRYIIPLSFAGWLLVCISCSTAFAGNAEWEQATHLYSQGDYRGALSGFQKIAERMPRDPSVHYMLGQCYKNLNNTKQAVSELEWVSKYATDPRIKNGAIALLAQMKPGTSITSSGGIIPGAISPYSVAPFASTSSSTQPARIPPPKTLLNDSVSYTVSEAYKKGWVPCKGTNCLNYGTSGWHHEKVEGYPDSNMWMVYPKPDGKQYISQLHVGELVKDGVRMGACPVCNGSGWVPAK